MGRKILVLAVTLGIALPAEAVNVPSTYDGKWWSSSTKDRRLGLTFPRNPHTNGVQ